MNNIIGIMWLIKELNLIIWMNCPTHFKYHVPRWWYIQQRSHVFPKPLLEHTLKHKQEKLQKGYGILRTVFGNATSPLKSLKSKGIH